MFRCRITSESTLDSEVRGIVAKSLVSRRFACCYFLIYTGESCRVVYKESDSDESIRSNRQKVIPRYLQHDFAGGFTVRQVGRQVKDERCSRRPKGEGVATSCGLMLSSLLIACSFWAIWQYSGVMGAESIDGKPASRRALASEGATMSGLSAVSISSCPTSSSTVSQGLPSYGELRRKDA